MSYQKIFPKILEKTYKSCKNFSVEDLPLVRLSSRIFGTKVISLPFLDTTKLNKITGEVLETFVKNRKEGIEIKSSELNLYIKPLEKYFIRLGFNKNIVKGHMVSKLTTNEDYWRRFHKHTRNDIRKAEKSGLKIKKINSIIELKSFYKLYFKQMKRFGTPQHSFKFFKNCFKIMGQDFFGLNCYKKDKLIGSIILFLGDSYAYVSFNVSNYKFRNFRPNDLLYWEALKWCMKNDFKFFDIGQIDLNPEKETRAEALLKFKKKWLGKEYKKIYFTKGFEYNQSEKDSLKRFRKTWSKLPNFVIKLIGPKICSQLG